VKIPFVLKKDIGKTKANFPLWLGKEVQKDAVAFKWPEKEKISDPQAARKDIRERLACAFRCV
jgi:hypothetical protein